MESPYYIERNSLLTRRDTLNGEKITLEPGVNYFVKKLEALGAKVLFSCEGHPKGFSVVFEAPYELALKVLQAGYFGIEMMKQENRWFLSLHNNEAGYEVDRGEYNYLIRDDLLSEASARWEKLL